MTMKEKKEKIGQLLESESTTRSFDGVFREKLSVKEINYGYIFSAYLLGSDKIRYAIENVFMQLCGIPFDMLLDESFSRVADTEEE